MRRWCWKRRVGSTAAAAAHPKPPASAQPRMRPPPTLLGHSHWPMANSCGAQLLANTRRPSVPLPTSSYCWEGSSLLAHPSSLFAPRFSLAAFSSSQSRGAENRKQFFIGNEMCVEESHKKCKRGETISAMAGGPKGVTEMAAAGQLPKRAIKVKTRLFKWAKCWRLIGWPCALMGK